MNNSLAEVHPELVPEWSEKNLPLKGYGKILLDYSLEKAKELGCGAVCFEGNIDFYGKSGFKRQASLASAIMDCRKARMHLSFCAKN